MNNKVLSAILLTWIIATWFAWLSKADDITTGSNSTNSFKEFRHFNWEWQNLTDEQKAQMEEIKTILEKKKNWETLTSDEQNKLDEFEANRPQWWFEWKWHKWHDWFEKGFMWSNLTDEEKTALESMSDDEKKQFFETKMQEAKAEKEVKEAVIDALLEGKTLTSEQEVLRAQIIQERADMKAKMEERQAQMEEIKTIMEKKQNWETLTDEEQSLLDEYNPWKMWKWWFHR